MGPFGREGISYIHKKGRWVGRIIVEENGAKVIQALAQCSVLSALQAITIAGCGKNRKDILPRMFEKGYLDCYDGGHAPKLYALGEKGAELVGIPYRIWDTNGLLRLAAANQFWLRIKKIWPDATWDTSGEHPVFQRAEIRFDVLAPRQGQFEKMLALRALNICRDRVFIVAPDEDYAREIALNCPTGKLVRYTWDDELKDKLTIYRFHPAKKIFVEDNSFKVDKK